MSDDTLKQMIRIARWEIACGSATDALCAQHNSLVDEANRRGLSLALEPTAFDRKYGA